MLIQGGHVISASSKRTGLSCHGQELLDPSAVPNVLAILLLCLRLKNVNTVSSSKSYDFKQDSTWGESCDVQLETYLYAHTDG